MNVLHLNLKSKKHLKKTAYKEQVKKCIELLKNSERPVLISGYGIRLAKGEKEFLQLIGKLGIPIISSWTTNDLIPSFHELSIAKNNFGLERIYHCVYKDKYNDRYTVLLKIPRGEWAVCLLRIICLKGAFLWSSPNVLSLKAVMAVLKIQ